VYDDYYRSKMATVYKLDDGNVCTHSTRDGTDGRSTSGLSIDRPIDPLRSADIGERFSRASGFSNRDARPNESTRTGGIISTRRRFDRQLRASISSALIAPRGHRRIARLRLRSKERKRAKGFAALPLMSMLSLVTELRIGRRNKEGEGEGRNGSGVDVTS